MRALAEREARAVRLPLVWPDQFPANTRHALRAASYAAENGAGASFALAAMRLAFCGGFDLEDSEILGDGRGGGGAVGRGLPVRGPRLRARSAAVGHRARDCTRAAYAGCRRCGSAGAGSRASGCSTRVALLGASGL